MKFAIISALALALTSGSASAVTLLSYETEGGTSLTGQAGPAGVTADNLIAGSGITAVPNASTFNFRGWDSDSSAAAIAADEIWTWGFSSSVAYDLTDFSIALDRSGTGPVDFLIELAVNGSTSFISVLDSTLSGTTKVDFPMVDLSSFNNVTDADFRLSAFNASSGTGTFDLETLTGATSALQVTGEVSAVPLPAPALLLLASLFGLGALRFRRTA